MAAGSAAIALGLLVWCLAQDVRRGSFVSALRNAASIWAEASGGAIFLAGIIISLPLWASHMTTLAADSDSARLVAAIAYVRRFGTEYLVDTQEVLMPHLLLRVAMAAGGVAAMKAICVIGAQLLVGIIGYATWRLTRSPAAAASAAFAALAFQGLAERTLFLPMYGFMLAAGLYALVLMWDASQSEGWGSRLVRCFGAAVAFIVSIESHQVGQLWLLLSLLLCVVIPLRRFVAVALATYGFFGILMIPRLLINLAEGGTDGIVSNRIDYWITKDYLTPIQVEFWKLPVELPLGDYLSQVPKGIINISGYVGLGVILIVALSAMLARGRWRAFGLLAFGLVVGMAISRKLPFYSRYFAHLLVGAAIAAGAGVDLIRRRGAGYRGYAYAAMGLLGALALITVTTTANRAGAFEESVLTGAYATFERSLPEDASVAGTRATYLNFIRDDTIPYGEMFFTEEEYATFLSWPSDEEVLDVLRSRNIDHVMIPLRAGRWVLHYNNIWLELRGEKAVYHRRIKESDSFCRVASHKGAELYYVVGSDGGSGDAPC